MKITPFILAIRAVSAEFANRIYIPAVLAIGGGLLVLIAVAIWLVTLSGWWWLLLAPSIILTIVAIILAVIAWFIIHLVKPEQTKTQRKTVKSFVDGIQKTSEVIQTPKFIILFRLVKDLLLPGKKSFVGELSTTATTLKADLQTVIASFQN